MASKRLVEIFTAGCPLCEETVNLVRQIACSSCSIIVHRLQDSEGHEQARRSGIRSLPAVVIDGRLPDCCSAGGVDAPQMRAAGVGQPL